jgi:hypothetical protein
MNIIKKSHKRTKSDKSSSSLSSTTSNSKRYDSNYDTKTNAPIDDLLLASTYDKNSCNEDGTTADAKLSSSNANTPKTPCSGTGKNSCRSNSAKNRRDNVYGGNADDGSNTKCKVRLRTLVPLSQEVCNNTTDSPSASTDSVKMSATNNNSTTGGKKDHPFFNCKTKSNRSPCVISSYFTNRRSTTRNDQGHRRNRSDNYTRAAIAFCFTIE